jgi:hypothetical protein
MKVLVMQFPPVSRHFIYLRSVAILIKNGSIWSVKKMAAISALP